MLTQTAVAGRFPLSLPQRHFVGLPSAASFGPVMRFVYGTGHTAAMLAAHIRSPARQRTKPARPALGTRSVVR